MQEIEKNFDEIKKGLFSGNLDVVLETVNYIRLSNRFQDVELLLDLYITTGKSEVKKAIFDVLIDVKDTSFVDLFVKLLSKPKYQCIQNELVSVCWQNGLDYSLYYTVFVDLFKKGNDSVALECLTVLEEIVPLLDEHQKNYIKQELDAISSDTVSIKKSLVQSFMSSL